VALEKRARGVGAVDLETLVLGAMPFDQAEVMEQRADIEQLGVVVEAQRNTRREWSNSSRVDTSRTCSVASRASALSGIAMPAIVSRM
jgi:hypothetical protein